MMWPRKRLDIGWSDLAFGLVQTLVARRRPAAAEVVGLGWVPADESVIALSVRSGWDLLLTALNLPVGSEIITSAVTIPDMVRIIEHHGLVPVPVDVDAATLEVDVDKLERMITPRTRAVLIAHLFGSRMEMGPIVDVVRRHGLLVIEDCAQAFVGREYAGHADSDCAMFSFGPIKTATALGGAVVRVRDAAIRRRMIELQQAYPVQSRRSYARRLAKHAGFCVLTKPRVYGFAVRMLARLGKDYDRVFAHAARSFGASEFFTQIRRQPCVPLARMLARRVATFERGSARRLRTRTVRGHELTSVLPEGMVVGERNATQTFWVLPLRVSNGDALIGALRAAGFDVTRLSSLMVIDDRAPSPRPSPEGRGREGRAQWLKEIVYVPGGDDISESEWRRQVAILRQLVEPIESAAGSELLALAGVSEWT
jgi:perosamine synthetase